MKERFRPVEPDTDNAGVGRKEIGFTAASHFGFRSEERLFSCRGKSRGRIGHIFRPPFTRERRRMNYTTQMDAARKGIITKEMELVAEKEKMTGEEIRAYVAKGQIAIPCNRLHTSIEPNGIGSMLKTKINVNLGISRDCKDMDVEVEKVNSAVKMGAESIMDLSSFGDTRTFRRRLTSECPAIIGTVPIYDAVVYYHKALKEITTEEWLDIVRMHAEDGVDFMTIHCGINRATAGRFKENKRLTNIVSRGGSIIFAWMEMTGKENPFYEHFVEILGTENS